VIISADPNEWRHKGHVYGECMSHPEHDLMYIYIPKNASSWTKPNLKDWGWEFYNYHTDNLNKHALVILRDPVERWISGIAEYLTLYHTDIQSPLYETERLIFDRICFDDHTEKQIKFLNGIDTSSCTFMMCDSSYRANFSKFISERLGDNKYHKYAYQHVSDDCPNRRRFKSIFKKLIDENPKYLEAVKNYYQEDYGLINSIEFYGTR
jgi:hypothetical protein